MPAGCLWTLLVGAAWGASPVERYALVIGSNQGHPDETPLAYAEQDADRIADLLTSFGGFRSENLVSLRGQRAEDVRGAFASLARRVEAEREDDEEVMLFVYYSGHADNTALHLGRTDLSFAELKGLSEAVDSDVRVLVVDACRWASSPGSRERRPPSRSRSAPRTGSRARGS